MVINPGLDASGNGNNWTPINIEWVTPGVNYDIMVDSPTNFGTDTGVGGEVRGNYATLNPLFAGTSSYLSNGNLNASISASNTSVVGTFQIPSSGKWYWEYQITTIAGGGAPMGGVATTSASSPAVFYRSNGDKLVDGTGTSYGATYTTTDTIGIAVDVDGGTVTFYKNGSSQGAITYASAGYYPTLRSNIGTDVFNINFGQRPFAYAAPSGYKALCTTNLPDPTIADGADYFNTVLYTGNATNRSIDVGMAPDFTWIKHRSSAENHNLYDILRGAGYRLESNSTDSQTYYADRLTAFTSTGFDLGTGYNNTNGTTYVAWNWKAGGTGVTNTAGSITSTVSANTTAGFSIVTYTGTGSNATIGHGLGATPAFFVTKQRSGAENWIVYHKNQNASPASGHLMLQSTAAFTSSSTVFNNTAPTSSVFSVGTAGGTNESGQTFVAYCFAPVEGYSAFGSYTGNGSTDGVFVYTGFRPRYLLIKNYSTAGNGWIIIDTARSTYNTNTLQIYANSSAAESSSSAYVDILSNGFKLKSGNSDINDSGVNYIYAAFAENPFKLSRAR